MKKEKTTFQVRDLRKRLNRALKKKQELNTRIMKAIKYINNRYICQGALTSYEVNDLLRDLSDILQGSDKE